MLGGGVVPGAMILVGGDPGVGKSTLLLQVGTSAASATIMLQTQQLLSLQPYVVLLPTHASCNGLSHTS